VLLTAYYFFLQGPRSKWSHPASPSQYQAVPQQQAPSELLLMTSNWFQRCSLPSSPAVKQHQDHSSAVLVQQMGTGTPAAGWQ
jgi:hypothetical protein